MCTKCTIFINLIFELEIKLPDNLSFVLLQWICINEKKKKNAMLNQVGVVQFYLYLPFSCVQTDLM